MPKFMTPSTPRVRGKPYDRYIRSPVRRSLNFGTSAVVASIRRTFGDYHYRAVTGNDVPISGTTWIVPLTNINGQAIIYGSTSADFSSNKMLLDEIRVQATLRMNPSYNPALYTPQELSQTFSVYLVSLKDAMNDGTSFNPGTGVLTMSASDIYQASGLVSISPKRFNIKRRMQFTLDAPLLEGADIVEKTWSMVVRPKTIVRNTTGDINALECPRDPSKCYYLVIGQASPPSDNNRPLLDYNIVTKFKSLGGI